MTDSANQETAPEADSEQEDVTAADAHDAQAPQAPAAGDEGKPDLDEVKRKFRAALDRKREIHADGSGKGGQDSGKIHGAHGPARHDRQFRRKSG